MRIQFLYFEGCPLAPQARANLAEALSKLDPDTKVELEEIDLLAPGTPVDLKRWGSPCILRDGRDITGTTQPDACGCRVYTSDGGVPGPDEIAARLGDAEGVS